MIKGHFFKKTTLVLMLLSLVLSGCMTNSRHAPRFAGPMPKSILVLPPVNNSVEVNAPYTFISTISRPLGESGYYVFPVAVIDAFLKSNGLPTPAEMNNIPLEKINEHIGPDAVLYTTITDWGQKFQIIQSTSVVKAYLKLVDAKTGAVIWQGKISESYTPDSTGGQGGLVGALVGAVVDQIAGSIKDHTEDLSRQGAHKVVGPRSRVFPNGPYRIKTQVAKQQSASMDTTLNSSEDAASPSSNQ